MKFYMLMLMLILFAHTAHTQTRDGNKTKQIEQLQQLKQAVTRKIDSLQLQLMAEADSIEDLRKKLDRLKKEAGSQDKPDPAYTEETQKLSLELAAATNQAAILQKKYDKRLLLLDKTVSLQKDLEDKINTLVRESNR